MQATNLFPKPDPEIREASATFQLKQERDRYRTLTLRSEKKPGHGIYGLTVTLLERSAYIFTDELHTGVRKFKMVK